MFYCSPYFDLYKLRIYCFCHFRYSIAICIVFMLFFLCSFIFLYSLFQLYFSHIYFIMVYLPFSYTLNIVCLVFCVYIGFISFTFLLCIYLLFFRTAALIQAIKSLSERGIKYCIIIIIIINILYIYIII